MFWEIYNNWLSNSLDSSCDIDDLTTLPYILLIEVSYDFNFFPNQEHLNSPPINLDPKVIELPQKYWQGKPLEFNSNFRIVPTPPFILEDHTLILERPKVVLTVELAALPVPLTRAQLVLTEDDLLCLCP